MDEFKIILLSGKRKKNSTYCMIPFIYISGKYKNSIVAQSSIVVSWRQNKEGVFVGKVRNRDLEEQNKYWK